MDQLWRQAGYETGEKCNNEIVVYVECVCVFSANNVLYIYV